MRLVHDPFVHGITTIVMKRFDLEAFCTLVQKYRVVFAHVVPPVLLALSKDPIVSKYDLSSLKMLSSGAAPLTWPLTEAVNKRIGVAVKQAFGLSETSPTTHSQEWGDWSKFRGSVGRLLPNQELKYLDLSGDEVAPGRAGEICISGPNVFQGYWRNKSATENAFTKDGFFKTGDIGLEDEHGNLYITDRAKELIKYKGFQVAPAELEGILIGHSKVVDAAVIGVWMEEEATELPKAYIVLAPSAWDESHRAVEREAQDWIASRVASHKRLRGGVEVVQAIPKSPSGKILRRMLRDATSKSTEKVRAKL